MRALAPGTLAVGLAGCVLLCLVQLWPIALSPARQSLNRNDDARELAYFVTWIARELPRAPGSVLDTTVFYPARKTLATSEPLLLPGLIVAPVYALWRDAVLTHNAAWLAGFLLSSLAMYCLLVYLTRDRLAGFVAATLFIFNSHIVTRYPQLPAVHMEWLPAALLAFEAFLHERSAQRALGLGTCVLLAGVTGGYVAVYTLVSLAVVFLARVSDWWGHRRAVLGWLGVAAAVTMAAAILLLRPWLDPGLQRPQGGAATWASYISSAAWIHQGWSGPLFARHAGSALFPGVAASVLAAVGVVTGWRAGGTSRRRALAYLFVGAAGVLLSFGQATPALALVNALLPPAGAIRVLSRYGYLLLTAVAILAGLGVAAIRRRLAGRRWAGAAAVALLVAVNLEAYAPPVTTPYHGVPEIYRHVRRESGRAVLLELPYYHRPGTRHRSAQYMLNATAHWQYLVNGYGSYYPGEHQRFGAALARFPNRRALRTLRRLKVTHLMVNGARYDPASLQRLLAFLDAHPSFRLLARDGGGRRLYRVVDRAALGSPRRGRMRPADTDTRRTR